MTNSELPGPMQDFLRDLGEDNTGNDVLSPAIKRATERMSELVLRQFAEFMEKRGLTFATSPATPPEVTGTDDRR